MEPDDLPVFDEEPARYLDVSPRAVRPARSRAMGIAVTCISAGIVVFGLINRLPEPARGPSAPGAPGTPPAALTAERGPRPIFGWPPPSPAYLRPVQVVDLASPGLGTVRVTSERLTVAGKLLVKAARVEIVLAANGNRRFGQASADVSDRDGGIRPADPPTFDVEFDLAGAPRPTGPMLVVVTAYSASGEPIGALQRAVSIEPLGSG